MIACGAVGLGLYQALLRDKNTGADSCEKVSRGSRQPVATAARERLCWRCAKCPTRPKEAILCSTRPPPTEKSINPTGGNLFSPPVKAPGPPTPAPGNLPGNH